MLGQSVLGSEWNRLAVGYYAFAVIFTDAGAAPGSVLIWSVVACVAGPVFGTAGHWWRFDPGFRRRVVAPALLGGVFFAEGLWSLLAIIGDTAAAVVEVVVGVLILLILGRSARERLAVAAVLIPASLVILGVSAIIDRAMQSV